MVGQAPGQRALAGRRGAVDRDDEIHVLRRPIPAPSPFISSVKPGKLVSIGLPSSISIGALAAMPMTRNDIAGRWSRLTAIRAPPFGALPLPVTASQSLPSSTVAPQAA